MVEGHKRGLLKIIRKTIQRNKLGELLVSKGIIDQHELRSALKSQKETSRPLGQIFVENAVISPWRLKMLLGRQFVLRGVAASLLFAASFTTFNAKRAQAEPMTGIHMVSASAEFTRVAAYPALLGTSEKKDRNLKAFTKWTSMFSRFDRQLKQQANLELVQDWQRDIDKLQGRSMKGMVAGVNG